jgi:fructose-bisphosphate aldolase class I
MSELNKIALKIISNGKGILAADESNGTMTKRLENVQVPSTPENRLLFRETLFSSTSMKNCIGGVILYDETIKQISSSKKKIPELISETGAVPGIKVDTGAKVLSNSTDEKITEGLDGLRERLKEYYKLGARFTKWRAVYVISEKYPSKIAIYSNAHALAKYAALVQEARMVPIVEPEVLMDGDHNAEECFKKTSEVLKKCFKELIVNKVQLNGIILKPNMVLPGTNSDQKINNKEIAEMTIKCLRESVPKEVPGIAFLSGGQSESDATKNLNLINVHNNTNFIMTFSYGRALQQSALKFWSKNLENIEETQKIFNHRANMNSLAAQGKWTEEIEKI